jgi:hypothetical protein
MSLTLIVPKVFPSSGPLRVMVDVPHTLLHHFDPSLESGLELESFMRELQHPVSLELAQRAMTTCFGPDNIIPKIHESFISSKRNNRWTLRIHFDYLIPAGEKNPPVISFQANEDLDEDGNVEFLPILLRTEKAREKYNSTVIDLPEGDSET